ncbi:MAG: hypothetical protein WD200_03650 [Candidatus Andersenbacteria bacterium]
MIAEILPAEGDPNEPVTRGEFNEAMHAVNSAFQQVATKDDLKALENRMATKDDMETLRMATKDDMETLRMATKSDLNGLESRMDKRFDELFEHIDSYIDNRMVDVGAARSDEVLMIKEKQERYEKRISALEANKY